MINFISLNTSNILCSNNKTNKQKVCHIGRSGKIHVISDIHKRGIHLQKASNCARRSLLDRFNDSPTSFDVL